MQSPDPNTPAFAVGSTEQTRASAFHGIARHTPEGIAWRDMAMKEGFREAVRRRDAPWENYGERK